MRFHVVSLPHTCTTSAYPMCAYTQKCVKFCRMMMDRGHEVFLYSGEQNDAPCTEHISCIPEVSRAVFVGDNYLSYSWDTEDPLWKVFNASAAAQMAKRLQQKDFICLIGGRAHKPIADAFPAHMSVEFGIGYSGTFAKYRVWESYAWMHAVYGKQSAEPMCEQGKWYDAVIPNYFDPDDFPWSNDVGDYYLFLGRLTELKGYQIAADVCEHLGARLVLAGSGTPPKYGEYFGVASAEDRAILLSGAKAVFVPTQYLEPFGGVAVEAMLCGTPVITTDWGAFTETVRQGVDGYRCRNMAEFIAAARAVPDLDRKVIRWGAQARYSLAVVGQKYEEYFLRLMGLWGEGWSAKS